MLQSILPRWPQKKAAECGFEILPHPAYSPDLAPSDFHLFPKVKKELRGRKFNSDEEVIDAVTLILEDLPESWYEAGLRKLKQRWEKCISIKGDYVEK